MPVCGRTQPVCGPRRCGSGILEQVPIALRKASRREPHTFPPLRNRGGNRPAILNSAPASGRQPRVIAFIIARAFARTTLHRGAKLARRRRIRRMERQQSQHERSAGHTTVRNPAIPATAARQTPRLDSGNQKPESPLRPPIPPNRSTRPPRRELLTLPKPPPKKQPMPPANSPKHCRSATPTESCPTGQRAWRIKPPTWPAIAQLRCAALWKSPKPKVRNSKMPDAKSGWISLPSSRPPVPSVAGNTHLSPPGSRKLKARRHEGSRLSPSDLPGHTPELPSRPGIDTMSHPPRPSTAWLITGAGAGLLLPFGVGNIAAYLAARILKGDTEAAF